MTSLQQPVICNLARSRRNDKLPVAQETTRLQLALPFFVTHGDARALLKRFAYFTGGFLAGLAHNHIVAPNP